MYRAFLLVALLGFATGIQKLSAEEKLVLVNNGRSLAPIVIYKDAPPFTRGAADELAEYIEKISGARPEIIEGKPDRMPAHAIWVGYQPVLDKLFPDISFEFKHPEEILIAANDKHLVIAGRDVWDPEYIDKPLERNLRKSVGIQKEYGTANAVYTFIQDFLDVRWLWPGEVGEDVIKQYTIAIDPVEYRYHPQVRGREGMFFYSSLGRKGKSEDWTRHQRVLLDSLTISPGHAFQHWWKDYYKDHPEMFALQPDGTRGTWPPPMAGRQAGVYVKLCQSNPEVWDLWLAEVEDQLKENPYLTIFNASPNDGANDGVCICEKCRALDNPDGKVCPFHWLGFGQEYVSMSDRQLIFVRRLYRKLMERFPDKDYSVQLHGYGSSRFPPAGVVPPEQMLLSYVGTFPWGTEENRSIAKENIQGWMSKGNHKLIYRPNSGRQPGLPETHLKRTIEDFKWLANHRWIGIFIDTNFEHWSTCGPQYYLMGLLAWDPQKDGEAIMADYYRRGFGPAAEEIEQYFNVFERQREYYLNNPNKELHSHPFSMNLARQAQAILDRAAAKAAGNRKYAQRVEFIQAGLSHTTLILENYDLIDRLRDSDGTDTAAADKARKNYETLQELWKQYPLAINGPSLGPGSRRLRNLHPDQPYGAKVQKVDEFKEPEKLKPAKEEGWKLCFEDDFSRKELGNDWKAIEGVWKIKDGALHGSGTLISTSDKLRGEKGSYQRMEFTAISDVKSLFNFPDKAKFKANPCDLSSFIHAVVPQDNALPIYSGYFFQFGGEDNSLNRITKGSENCTINPDAQTVIEPGKEHKIVVENNRGHLKHFVDGLLIQEYKDPTPLVPAPEQNQVGFYFYSSGIIKDVKVYTKPAGDNGKRE